MKINLQIWTKRYYICRIKGAEKTANGNGTHTHIYKDCAYSSSVIKI